METIDADKALQAFRRLGRALRQLNEDKPMKYRVNVDIISGHNKGDKIDNPTYHGLLDYGCPKKWFEPVEQVQEGQWIKNPNTQFIARVNSVEGSWADVTGIAGHGAWIDSGDVYIGSDSDILGASTDEIEQALIKEAKRRGFPTRKWIRPNGNSVYVNSTLSDSFIYYKEEDTLKLVCGEVYKQGTWAEIVDQTPHTEINGKTIEVEDGTVKISCGDTIEGDMFKKFYAVVNKYNLAVSRNGEDINEQLRQIWDEMQQKLAGTELHFEGTLEDVTFSTLNMCGNNE